MCRYYGYGQRLSIRTLCRYAGVLVIFGQGPVRRRRPPEPGGQNAGTGRKKE